MFLGAFLSFLFFYAWRMMNMEPRAQFSAFAKYVRRSRNEGNIPHWKTLASCGSNLDTPSSQFRMNRRNQRYGPISETLAGPRRLQLDLQSCG
jgi:hypothetical protein